METLVVKRKLLSLKDMESIARNATRDALSAYPEPPKEEQSHWVLRKFEDGEFGHFEIYIPGERPEDAEVVSLTRVHRHTGEVSVEVFLEK